MTETIKSLVLILLGGAVLNNYAFLHFMGISAVLGSAKETKKAAVMGLAVTIVSVIAAAIAWPVETLLLSPLGLGYLQTLTFTAIVLAAVGIVTLAAKLVVKKPLGIWFPLIALNSTVLGVMTNNAAEGLDFVQAVVTALGVGLGFLLALVVFCGVRSCIEDQYIPKAFRGLPAQLMAAVIIALALYAF